jgi:predicted nuclease of predicted toxin-antitoxin system
MRFFIDENLSPSLVRICNAAGFDAACSRDRHRLGRDDPSVAELCFEEDRICVTVNAGDFRQLAEHNGLHAGLITMPSVAGERQRELMAVAIEVIQELSVHAGEDPASYMINRVLELEADGSWSIYNLPEAG